MVKSFDNRSFTVIIPTFNRAENLRRCLKSLENQTFKEFEVIVCDDGSTDHTKAVVDYYQDKLKLKYFYEENWGGPARPRNIGVDHASTDWILFVDSDDCFAENKIEVLSNIQLKDFDLIYHDLDILKDGKSVKIMKSRHLKNNPYLDLLFNLNAIPTSSVLVRTELLKKVNGFSENRELIAVEDFDLWIRLCETNHIRTKYIPRALGYYYLGDDNITTADDKQINRFKALYMPYIDKAKDKYMRNKIEGALHYQIGRIYAIHPNSKQAIPYLLKSIKLGSDIIKLKAVYQIFTLLKEKLKS
jgi:glycosyltransferase involved in cell wall biosynthesis